MPASPHGFWNLAFLPNQSAEMELLIMELTVSNQKLQDMTKVCAMGRKKYRLKL